MSAKDEEERTPGLDIIGLLADFPDELSIGDKKYKLYPLSLGKLKLMTKHEKAVSFLIRMTSIDSEMTDEQAAQKLGEAIQSAIEIFHIVSSPNDGKMPQDLTAQEKEELRWSLTMADIQQIMMFLRAGTIPKALLKNVRGPAAGAEKQTSEIGSQE